MKEWETEIAEWEAERSRRCFQRLYDEKKKRKTPRYEAFMDYRHHRPGGHFYSKESKWVRKTWQRRFRKKMEQNLYHEAYYHIRPRDYKTYGWITW